MLKLERESSREVHIALRHPERIFNKPLLKALGIAIALHIIAAALFNVTPFILRSYHNSLKSIVDVDPESLVQDKGTLASIEEDASSSELFSEPQPSMLPISYTSYTIPLSNIEYVGELSERPSSFPIIEKEIFESRLMNPPKRQSEVLFQVVGPLAEVAALSNTIFPLQDGAQITSGRVIFEVLVNLEEGKVFWYEKVESSSSSYLNRIAEEALHALQFTSILKTTVPGEIEVHFKRGHDD